MGVTPLTIYGVGVKAVAIIGDGGVRTLRLGAKSGGTADTIAVQAKFLVDMMWLKNLGRAVLA